MIEQAIIQFLQEALSVPCSAETPANPPEEYIVVEQTGSTRDDGLDKATVAVRSCAPTRYRAALLDKRVRGAMVLDLVAEPWAVKVSLNGSYPFTDTASKQERYQAVFDINFYEEAIPNGND